MIAFDQHGEEAEAPCNRQHECKVVEEVHAYLRPEGRPLPRWARMPVMRLVIDEPTVFDQ